MDLDFATLDLSDDSPANQERVTGWVQAVSRGFHEPRLKDETRRRWLSNARADGALARGAWLPSTAYGAGPLPVATFVSWPGELNTGSSMLPLHYISDVTVSPAHRRQGLLRAMMVEDLQAAAAAGRPLAALTVSEGSIYSRFGFGVATWRAKVEMDVSARFAVTGYEHVGRFEAVEPVDLWPVPRDLFAGWHAGQRGSLSRPTAYEDMLRGEWDWDEQAPDEKMRAAVHLDEEDRPDGYVLYRHSGWDRPYTVTVKDLAALTPQAHLAMWKFLGDIDLCERVKTMTPVDDPLTWALADPHCRTVQGVQDHIWLRVLDVVSALEGRPWFGDGSVALGITDSLGHAAGTWRVTASGGTAKVTPESGSGDVLLDVSTLGALYLGGTRVSTLAAAGRVTGDAGAIAEWGTMADGGPAPYSLTSF